MKIQTAVLGYPRIGINRELKKATESFWKGEIGEEALVEAGRQIRKAHWLIQKNAGIDIIPSNDFSFYDQMLDMTSLVGAVPARYGWKGGRVDFKTYFAMARGIQEKEGVESQSVPAMEMTKWFDTNYHYIVPEFVKSQGFKLSSDKPVAQFKEAKALGILTRPVLIGPVTYLGLGKVKEKGFSPFSLLAKLLPVYAEVLKELKAAGAQSVQMDEPLLVTDLSAEAKKAYPKAYAYLRKQVPGLEITLATYFGSLGVNAPLAAKLPVDGLHVDLVRGEDQWSKLAALSKGKKLISLGVVEGRNIWITDLNAVLKKIKAAQTKVKTEILRIAPTSSLMHVPLDLSEEKKLDAELKSWLSFARQKLDEVALLKKALTTPQDAKVKSLLAENAKAVGSRKASKRIHVAAVKARLKKIKASDFKRLTAFGKRQKIQEALLKLPAFPTTTIGSFPQTGEIRQARLKARKGELSASDYAEFIRQKTREVIEAQERIGIDVLVHGEFERNDMVEYFGEKLEGFVFTQNGWVQSYGSRYVKPPVIFGDVWRKQPMTVDWYQFAQSLTDKPVKGMLTGPITILQWSFVRDDQPRKTTSFQIALAILDEVRDLEAAGSKVIQIDEPAIREGLPLRKKDWKAYLKWAVDAFRLSSSGVKNETQIHTHMCYSEFNDIIDSIAAMDADVISIETSRSQMELLDAFARFRYPNEIGPGVYDIHSPRVPSVNEMESLLKKASRVIPPKRLWVNPDCGLKTRAWKETTLSLENMVKAAKNLREAVTA